MIREVGPPDLCHIVKIHTPSRSEPDIGSYHHVLGVDTSTSASLAAYINSLQYSLSETQGWFGSGSNWKIASGTYCTYNAFSNVDLRVQVKIPGGVDAYIVTPTGDRKEVTEDLWKECHVSSLLRAILYADPTAYSVTGLRRMTPVASPREETKFVEAIVEQFWNGWALGSNAETQVASTARNFLVDGLMRYFSGEGRYADCAAEILAPLAYAPLGGQQSSSRASAEFKGIDPEVAALLAETYMEGDEEVQAVRVMHQALKVKSSCYPLLATQAEFLRRKKCPDAALTVARMAVKYAPSEFQAWAKLTEIYLEAGDYQRAMLTLNSCPMYTFVDHDYPRVPTPRRINFPVKSDVLADYDLGEQGTGTMPPNSRASLDMDGPGLIEEMALNENSTILRLSAPTLRCTFARVYKFLTEIVSTIGWDELLLLRSQVFVMEEEYRNSAVPSAAVDDEDLAEDDDEHLPLSALRERHTAELSRTSEGEPSADAALPSATDAVDNAVTEETSAVDADAQAINEDPVADPELNSAAEPAAEAVAEPATESETPAAASASASEEPGKGKKKNKKNKGKKSKENLKAEIPPPTEPPAVTDATNDGDASAASIVAIGEQMDVISLSDTDHGEAKEPESQQPQSDIDSGPQLTEQLSAPQTAVFETAPIEPTPAPEHLPISGGDEESLVTKPEEPSDIIRKRLCERWLDNLIMILFDDLRMYTSWRSRMHNLRATGQPVTYRYTQAEWEALGDLALRLRRPSEAREAYEYALAIRFSARAWQRLLEMHSGVYTSMQQEEQRRHEGVPELMPLTSNDSLMQALDAVVWLSVYHDRWYNNMAYPNPVCEQLIKLINIHGLSKVRNSMVSMNLKPAVFNMVKKYFEVAEKFNVRGSKW
ncbi:bud site selection protein [Coemansia spiralis]|uniref:Bud site selection protein n=1 Tax=Coemansia spiralis TaxID=417178 RepID=A0A9W8L2A8_9FUNG|nr:bud site selection protein [Coemansia spiralis]